MSAKDAYQQRVEAEVELAQAKLAEIKAKARGYAADARIDYAKQVDELEENIEQMRAKLQKLEEADDDAWEHLKGEVEGVWDKLKVGVRDIGARLKQ